MKTSLTPKTANTMNKVCKLKIDNITCRGSWMCIDNKELVIQNQKLGEEPTGKVVLTKKQFERFIKFYETGL